MKYNLDDLISKAFEGKESVSPGFSQSVIDKMQMASGGTSGKNRWMFAAACIGMALAAGAMMFAWKADFGLQKEKQSVRWAKSATERKVAEVPDGNGKQPEIIQGVEDADLKEDGRDEKPLDNQGDGGEGKNVTPEPAQSAESVSDQKKEKQAVAEKNLKAEKWQRRKDSRNSREMSISPQNQTVKPLPDTEGKPSATKKPSATEKPSVTKKPSVTEKPSVTKKPSATEKPGGSDLLVAAQDYTPLCSMKCSSPEGEDMYSVNLAFSSYIEKGVLSNRAVTSYDQLQELLQKIQNARIPGDVYITDWLVQQLEQYNQEYFQENVLYCYNVFLTAGYDFGLSSVNLIEEEGGKRLLKIAVDHIWAVPPGMCVVDVMCYYSCFIQIPKEVAEACDTIKCSLADGPDWAELPN